MFNSSETINLNELLNERDKRRLKAVWELFHSELIFLTRQLLVLRWGFFVKKKKIIF